MNINYIQIINKIQTKMIKKFSYLEKLVKLLLIAVKCSTNKKGLCAEYEVILWPFQISLY